MEEYTSGGGVHLGGGGVHQEWWRSTPRVVEEYTKDIKEEEGEEEVATEVVEATTPPTRITLEIEPTTSIAAPDTTQGVAMEDPT